jgi:hypothetical protein
METQAISASEMPHVTSGIGFSNVHVTLNDAPGVVPPKVLRRFFDPSVAYKEAHGRDQWEDAEYDLYEPGVIEDTESYFRQFIRKKKGLAFKEGWEWVGKDPKTIEYIHDRVTWLEEVQRKSFRILFKEIFHELLQKSNAYLFKVRDKKASNGEVRKEGAIRLDPIAGYFIAPAETIQIKRDNSGRITKARQLMPDGKRSKEFTGRDVVHFTIDKKVGRPIGTPIVEPVKDDIRALRRVEEHVDLLVYQHLFPLFQYVVGTKERPAMVYPDGNDEITIVRQQVEFLPPEGVIVTPERHEIRLIGAQGKALKAEGFLKHFKERVFGGVGMSSVDYGEGSTVNRATANTVTGNTIDDVKDIQDDLEAQFDLYVLRELLLEGGFDFNPLARDRMVHLHFKEVDLDAKIAFENHVAQMYEQYIINEDEARQEIGREPKDLEDEDYRDKTFWRMIKEPETLMISADEAYLATVKGMPNTSVDEEALKEGDKMKEKQVERETKQKVAVEKAKPKMPGMSSGQRSGAARNRPSNQHGKRSGPKTRDFLSMADNLIDESFADILNELTNYKERGTDDAWLRQVVELWRDRLAKRFSILTSDAYVQGTAVYGANPYISPEGIRRLGHVRSRTNHYVEKLAKDLIDRLSLLNGSEDVEFAMTLIEIQRNRLNAIYRTELVKGYNYGTVFGMLARGFTQAIVTGDEEFCETCTPLLGTVIDLKEADISSIPSFHPNCDCRLEPVTSVTPRQEDSFESDVTSEAIDRIACDVVRLLSARLGVSDADGPPESVDDGKKKDSCVKKTRESLRKRYPNLSAGEIDSRAIAICTSQLEE